MADEFEYAKQFEDEYWVNRQDALRMLRLEINEEIGLGNNYQSTVDKAASRLKMWLDAGIGRPFDPTNLDDLTSLVVQYRTAAVWAGLVHYIRKGKQGG
jgi:hypothetical protein